MTMPVSDSQEKPDVGNGAPKDGRWGREFWAKTIAAETPRKADPDVLRICNAYRVHYGAGKALKALSYGIAVESEILAWCFGRSHGTSGIQVSMDALRRKLPANAVKQAIRPRGDAAYIIEDQQVLRQIREAMNEAVK